MAVNVFPIPSTSDNWVQIATNTPSGVNSVTFSSIAQSYSKLLLVLRGTIALAGISSPNYYTINNATSGYTIPITSIAGTPQIVWYGSNSNIQVPSIPTGGVIDSFLLVESANNTLMHRIQMGMVAANTGTGGSLTHGWGEGFFQGSAYISTISWQQSTNLNGGVVFTLYGVRA